MPSDLEDGAKGDGSQQRSPRRPFSFKDDNGRSKPERFSESRTSRKRHSDHHSSRSRKRRSRRAHRDDGAASYHAESKNLPSDQAFKESLFDAMGDDEGAQFWEGVYGQPIHKYPNGTLNEHTGELEQMNDEDYAQYVRRKMWEKSREGIEAAREEEQKRKARARAEQQERQEAPTATAELESGFIFDFEIDASLSRGRRRKEKKRWQELWEQYLKRWEELQSLSNNASDTEGFKDLHLRNKIPWPVESGKRKDLAPEEIDRFMRKVTESQDNEGKSASELLSAVLKVERVRWHPDKIQQRYGFMQIDDLTMRGVTATFQVLDRMWNDLREVKKP